MPVENCGLPSTRFFVYNILVLYSQNRNDIWKHELLLNSCVGSVAFEYEVCLDVKYSVKEITGYDLELELVKFL